MPARWRALFRKCLKYVTFTKIRFRMQSRPECYDTKSTLLVSCYLTQRGSFSGDVTRWLSRNRAGTGTLVCFLALTTGVHVVSIN